MKSVTNNGPQENDSGEQGHTPVPLESVPHHQGNHSQKRHYPRMNWRLASRLSVITFAILVIIVVTIIKQQGSSAPSLPGTDLGKQPAPSFQLTDQSGQQVSLAQFKGKPVVLTFLYTHCPDVCPLTAEHLHSTLLKMGKDAKNVGVLAVSTDPQRDDQTAAIKFTNDHNMQDYWHFLIGTHEQLSSVWSAYSVYAQQQQTTVNHSSAIYVIDKQGNNRVFVGQDFKPDELASYLKTLVHE
jgi:protein SCO1